MDYAELTKRIDGRDIVSVSGYKDGECTVEVAERAGGYFDPLALAIQTLDGKFLGYVAKKDKLRNKMRQKAEKEEVTLPVLVANYYKEGEDKLWKTVEPGDLTQLWLRAYSKRPVDDDTFVEIESFTGEKVLWSEYLHICTDLKGNELLGGSTYANQFEKEFDRERIATNYAKKHNLDKQAVIDYWSSLGDVAADYGTSVHKALEHYSNNYKTFGHEDSLPRVPHLREAVKQYLKVSDFENCIAEPLITDVEKGMSGWIDSMKIVGKTVTIRDYKTNTFKDEQAYRAKWPQQLKKFNKQMDFYGTILENHGYTVTPHEIFHWHEGKWDRYELEFNKVKEYSR